MNFFRHKLSLKDVERLLVNPSPQNKIETVSRIMADFSGFKDNPEEVAIATDIIARLAGDVEVAVRQAIAWQVAHSPILTADVAKRLAADVVSVAFPILRYAQLPEDTLLEAVEANEPRKTLAVAGRRNVSAKVSEAIIATANIKAITVLMGNATATITTPALHRVLDQYGIIPAVSGAMAKRPELTADIVTRLVAQVSEGVRRFLVETYQLDPDVVRDLVAKGRDAALVVTLQPIAESSQKIEPFLRRLDELGELSPAFLFRSLCAGEIQMFRLGLSLKGQLPLLAIDELLRDRGPLGLPALMRRCGIPMSLLPAFKAAIVVWREDSPYDGDESGRAAFQARVLTAVFDSCIQIDDGEIDELLQHIFTLSSAPAIRRAAAG